MKTRGLLLASLVLLLAALACSLVPSSQNRAEHSETQPVAEPIVPTPTLDVPTEAPPTDVPPTETLAPTEPLVPTEPPQATAAPTSLPTTPAPQAAGSVVLVRINPQPGQVSDLRVVDAVAGMTQGTFEAADLTYGANNLVGGKSVFYVDSSSKVVYRIGFDGQAQPLSFMNPDNKIFDGLILPSPDGSRIAWSKVVSEDASGTHVQLFVANVDGSQQKVVIDETRPQPSQPEPVRWSNDGQSLYYTNMPYGIGGYILFFGGPDLVKLDLASGQSTKIITTGCLCAMALSPDETRVAYVQKPEADQMNVYVRSLNDGSSAKGSLWANHMQGGAIVWAPDSQSFMIASAVGNPDQEAYSVLLFNVADMTTPKTLIPDDPRLLQPVLWPAAGVVWLNDKDNNAWRMDPSTGNLTQTSTGEMVLRSTH